MPDALVVENLRGRGIGPIDLIVGAGACAAIGGPSGAGKSLLLRMIADLDPNQGVVRLGDHDRDRMAAPEWRRRVVHLAAEPGWWEVRAGAHFPDALRDAAEALATRLRLPADVMTREVRTLSTGERQRLALVRALVREPACLLLDEPTSALDGPGIERIEDVLRETMSAGSILVLVSHDAAQAERIGTDRYRLDDGRLTRQ